MPRRSNVEILAPRPARELVVDRPVIYQEYPKTLEHPQGVDNHFPPVIVNDWSQEQEYVAKGYEPPGKGDPFGFLTSRATEKADDAIRLMNAEADQKIEAARVEIRLTVREAIEESLGQVSDAIDALRVTHRRVPLIEDELARLRGEMRAMSEMIDLLSRTSAQKPWWRRLLNV